MIKSIIPMGLVMSVLAGTVWAGHWYAGPTGKSTNPGTEHAPWDIASALDGGQEVTAGDTIYLLEGTYRRRPKENFVVRLAGAEDKPIHIRPVGGARATIDGGLEIQKPAAHVWIWELEILVGEPRPQKPVSPGSHPEDLKRPWGGLHMYGGKNCKYINLVIHDTNQGISCWKDEIDCEIYGCLIYSNGWLGTDRGHGHCIYTQNDTGIKTISNCIMSCLYDGTYSMHAYGSERAYVNNYLVTENIVYDKGPFLIGGGRPSLHIRALRNYLYNVDMRIGYSAPYNEDCEIRDNVIANGSLDIKNYRDVVKENNLITRKGAAHPQDARAILLPNKYDPNRANLAVFNWSGATLVQVDAASFLKPGDAFCLKSPTDFYGEPVLAGVCGGPRIEVPVEGEFAAFVMLRQTVGPGGKTWLPPGSSAVVACR
jgi:hypothetical protein